MVKTDPYIPQSDVGSLGLDVNGCMMDEQAHCTTATTKEKPQILQEASMCNTGINSNS
jgi:hypothetical protein